MNSKAPIEGDEYKNSLRDAMRVGDIAWWEMKVSDGSVDFHDRKARVLGYDPDDFNHYEDFTSLIHPDDYERTMDAMRTHVEGKRERYDVEYRIEASDGSYHWFHDIGGVTQRNDDGSPRIVSGLVIDITERKETKHQLSEARDFLDAILQAVPYPLYVLDVENYEIERSNLEGTHSEGLTCFQQSHQRDQPCHEGSESFPCPLEEVVEKGESTTVEHTHLDQEGNEVIHEVHAAPIFDSEGNVNQMVESLIDITARKEYERQITDQRDNLEVLNQVLRHDIRNDLQLVSAYADLLAERLSDENQAYVQTIQENASHAVELTTTARDMADVWLSDTDEQMEVPLKSTLESVLDGIRSTHSEAIITVNGRVPESSVLADDMLNSVFHNVLANALQHNDEDVPKVEVTVKEPEQNVLLRIADNGPGVPDDRKETIFGKGEKGLDSSGTGLGLYLVKTLVETYEGGVWVEDNEPEGAVFVIKLPKPESKE